VANAPVTVGGLREGVWVCGGNHRLFLGQLFELSFNSGYILVPGLGKQIRLQLAKGFAFDAETGRQARKSGPGFVIFAVNFGLSGLQ
jgi:hypothetical protein